MELPQQYLGAPTISPQSLSSSLPTSSAFTFATSTFQYLPAESSTLFPPENWDSDEPNTVNPFLNSYDNLSQQGPSNCNQLTESGPSSRGRLVKWHPVSLAECWRSIDRTARILLKWCKDNLSLSSLPDCEDTSAYGTEDIFYNDDSPWQYAQSEPRMTPDAIESDENGITQIPQYVMDYAPVVHLYSGEEYWPGDIGEHLYHITPRLNFTPVPASWQHPRLDNLNALNRWEHGRHLFLTSDDNVEDHPKWLMGKQNIPAAPTPSSHRPGHHSSFKAATQNIQVGRSDAPAVLIVVKKGHGIVDAFWFFFYSFNLGNVVVLRFGNHVGDWEHSVVRFHNGKPKAVFVSEHFFGQAYSYKAMEKIGKRPVIYSATGTHAMYATPGAHSYILPWGFLRDRTDRGPLWDPALNSYMYTYDLRNDTLQPSNFTPTAPTEWFHFAGHWGDKQYPLGDLRQYVFAGNYHYVSGPLGPKFKNLGRRKICQGRESERCVVKNWLGGSRLRRVHKPFEDRDISEEQRVKFATQNGNR